MNRVIKDIRYDDQAIYKIKVPSNKHGHVNIDVNQIVRCEAESNYTKIVTVNKETHILSKTLKYVEEEVLPKGHFIRPHQSHLINIDQLDKHIISSTLLTLMNGDQIPISRSRKYAIKQILFERGIELL
jgi:two-component system LytT family response regulator